MGARLFMSPSVGVSFGKSSSIPKNWVYETDYPNYHLKPKRSITCHIKASTLHSNSQN